MKILILEKNKKSNDNIKNIINQRYDSIKEIYQSDNTETTMEIINNKEPDIVIFGPSLSLKEIKEVTNTIKMLTRIIGFIYTLAILDSDLKFSTIKNLGVNDFIFLPTKKYELILRLECAKDILKIERDLRQQCEKVMKITLDFKKISEKNIILATTDELTNLLNRREAISRIKELWSMSDRHDTELSCIYLDIDHFKHYNDIYGHDIGDKILVNVSKRLKETTRNEDIVARWGGEEFLVICQMIDENQTIEAAQRICESIRSLKLKVNNTPINLTISAGVSMKDKEMNDYNDLICKADKKLYKAKQEGRDKVCN